MKKNNKKIIIYSLSILSLLALPSIAMSCTKPGFKEQLRELERTIDTAKERKSEYAKKSIDVLSLFIVQNAIEEAEAFYNDKNKDEGKISQIQDTLVKKIREAEMIYTYDTNEQKQEKIQNYYKNDPEKDKQFKVLVETVNKKYVFDMFEQEILMAQRKKGTYLYDVDDTSLNIISKAIDKAEGIFADKNKTIKEIQEARKELQKEVEKAENYFNLTTKEKQELLQNKFDDTIKNTENLKNSFEKPDAIELLEFILSEAKTLTKNEDRYYFKLNKMIHKLQEASNEATILESKTHQQLYNDYLLKESKILNDFEQQYGNSDTFLDIQDKIKKEFQNSKNINKENFNENNYRDEEIRLKSNIKTIIYKASIISITPQNANSLLEQDGTSLIISPEVLHIKTNSFRDFETLKNVTFNSKLQTIESHAFDNTSITNISLPESLISLSGFNSTPINSLQLPKNLKIVDYAFNNATNLKTLIVNEGLIELKGFDDTKISELSLPESLEVFIGFRRSLITKISLSKNIKTFITALPELTELTLEKGIDLELINSSSNSGIIISKQIFPKLQKIYVNDNETKEKLLKRFGSDIQIINDEELITKQSKYEEEINKYKLWLWTHIDNLQKIANSATRNLPNLTTEQKNALKIFLAINNDDQLNDEIEYVIRSSSYNAKASLEQLDNKIDKLTLLISKLGYQITQENLNNDTNLTQDIKNTFINDQAQYKQNKQGFLTKEKESIKIKQDLIRYHEIVKYSEYYIEYLQDIYRSHIKKYENLSEDDKKIIRDILEVSDNTTTTEIQAKLDGFSYKNNYTPSNTYVKTEKMINNYIKILTIFNYDLSFEHVKNDTNLKEETRSDYEFEKNKYNNSKGNEWNSIIEIKSL